MSALNAICILEWVLIDIYYNYENSVVSNVKATKFTAVFEYAYGIKERWLIFPDVMDVIGDNLKSCKKISGCTDIYFHLN